MPGSFTILWVFSAHHFLIRPKIDNNYIGDFPERGE